MKKLIKTLQHNGREEVKTEGEVTLMTEELGEKGREERGDPPKGGGAEPRRRPRKSDKEEKRGGSDATVQ